MDEHMLSTVDNPWNPFTEFNEWYAYDTMAGHDTLSFLGRIIRTSDELSDADESAALEAALSEIVRENVTGMYILVTKDTDMLARRTAAAAQAT